MVERLHIRLLGEQELMLGATRLSLPPSKKTRALLAYLVLTGREQRRERLCELLWDVADDPRAALRWSLSKLRELLDGGGVQRLIADRQHVALALDDVFVDVFEARRLARAELAALSSQTLEEALTLFRGELLEGLELPDFHAYHAFCLSEREQARALHVRVLGELIQRNATRAERALPLARKWVELEPTSESARATFLQLLHASGREREAVAESRKSSRLLTPTTLALGDVEKRERPAADGVERRDVPPSAHPRGASAAEPVQASEGAARSLSGRAATDALLVRRSELPQPFVGRARELAQLSALEHEGGHALLLVTGEPGIGKSRLLEQLSERARARGRVTFRAAAQEVDPGFPFAPWSGLLAQAGMPLQTVATASVPAATEEDGGRWLDSAARALLALFGEEPALLVIDDLHWCDEASLRLLQHLLRAARAAPLLVAISARAGELLDNAPARRLLRAQRAEGRVKELALGPLAPEETAQLVRYVAAEVDAGLVHAESGGNPLFAIELARSPLREHVPSSITHVVRERMESLSPELVDVLRWAAVLGTELSVEQLERVMALDGEVFVSALEQLERLGWLRFDVPAPIGVRFAHELARRAVYDGLSSPRRRLMHARIARLLAASAQADERAAALAHHAALGGDAEMAVRACVTAGRRCLQLFAVSDALALAKRGLLHVPALPAREGCLLEIELRELALLAHKPAQPEELAARVLELAREAASRSELAHARRAFFLHTFLRWEQGRVGDAQRFSREAERLSRLGTPRERLRGLADAARCLVSLERDLADAHAFVLEAETLVAQGEAELACTALASGMLYVLRGEHEEAERALVRARELGQREGERLLEFFALEALLESCWTRGELERAEQLAQELVAMGERSREGSEACFARAAYALIRVQRGRDEEAALAQALEALRRADAKQRCAYVLVRWAEHALYVGRRAQAEQLAEEARGLAEAVERTTETVLARAVLARAALEAREGARAQQELAALEQLAHRVGPMSMRAHVALEQVRASLAAPARERARRGR